MSILRVEHRSATVGLAGVSLSLQRASAEPPHPSGDRGESAHDHYAGHAATLFASDDGEHVRRTRRLFCDTTDSELSVSAARSVLVAQTPQGEVLHVVDAAGEVCATHRVSAEEDVRQVAVDAQGDCAYVLTSAKIGGKGQVLSVDLRTGALRGRCGVGPYTGVALFAHPEGGLLVYQLGELKRLDGALTCQRSYRLEGFRPDSIDVRDDGTALILPSTIRPGMFQHLDLGTGGVLHTTPHVSFVCPQADEKGRRWFVAGASASRLDCRVTWYDPSSRGSAFFTTPIVLRAVAPLPGDRCIVVGRSVDVGGDELRIYATSGRELATLGLARGEMLKQATITEDGRQLYAVIERQNERHAWSCSLYRIDLDAVRGSETDAPAVSQMSAPRSVVSAADAPLLEKTPVYVADTPSFTMRALDDGRIIVRGAEGARLVSAYGAALGDFPTEEALRLALGPDAREITRDLCREGAVAQRLDEPSSAGMGDSASSPMIGQGFVDFVSTERHERALQELGLESEAAVKRLQLGRDMANLALGTVEVPFPSGDDAWVVVDRNRVSVRGLSGKSALVGRHQDLLEVEPGTYVTSVLPLRVDDRHYVVAATTDGQVHWLAPAEGPWHERHRARERFSIDMGESVASLALGEENRVYASGTSGRMLLIEPGLACGTRLETIGQRPDSLSGSGGVEVGSDAVRVGGVTLPRRITPD